MTASVTIKAASKKVLVRSQDKREVFGSEGKKEWLDATSFTIEPTQVITVHVWDDRRVIVEEAD